MSIKITDTIKPFILLGKSLQTMDNSTFENLCEGAASENPWFTSENIKRALDGIIYQLDESKLMQWTGKYTLNYQQKTIGIVMAGNIPFVGFHDFLSVLVSGNKIMAKLSSKDTVLPKFIIQKLLEIAPELSSSILLVEKLKDFDAVIATGSDNSSRYFDYYFDKYPNLIRKNRSSIGILSGYESEEDLQLLGEDIFSYFGLGCRNISKLYLPENYDIERLKNAWSIFSTLQHHHKFRNNYEYNRSIYLVNRVPHEDFDFAMLKEGNELSSPISVIHYEYYTSREKLMSKLQLQSSKIQCISTSDGAGNTVKFGQCQRPELWDYADGYDTMNFLCGL